MSGTSLCAISAALLMIACSAGTLFAVDIETVRVGNPGNAGEWSGDIAYGPYDTARICGSVGYTYNIGKYEVTAGQYAEFLNKVGGVDTYGLYNPGMANITSGSGISRSGGGTAGNPYTYSVAVDFVDRPVNYVSWGDSARFANWLHNGQPKGAQGPSTTEDGTYFLNGATSDAALSAVDRKADWTWAIPSEDEWYKAAYYKGGSTNAGYWDYPTGSNTVPGRDLADVSGNNANIYGDPYPIQSPYYTTVVGEFQISDSRYGTFDQGGNVWEWNEAVITGTYGSSRGARGGSFFDVDYIYLLASCRGFCCPTYEDYDFGFRVVQVPDPATLSLLAIGGLVLIRRRG